MKFKLRNVEFSMRAIPLGGYVGFPNSEQDNDIAADDKDLLKKIGQVYTMLLAHVQVWWPT